MATRDQGVAAAAQAAVGDGRAAHPSDTTRAAMRSSTTSVVPTSSGHGDHSLRGRPAGANPGRDQVTQLLGWLGKSVTDVATTQSWRKDHSRCSSVAPGRGCPERSGTLRDTAAGGLGTVGCAQVVLEVPVAQAGRRPLRADGHDGVVSGHSLQDQCSRCDEARSVQSGLAVHQHRTGGSAEGNWSGPVRT